jgi:hypothetical protein
VSIEVLGDVGRPDPLPLERMLAQLAHVAKEDDPRYRTAIRRALASIATPERIRARGKFIGDFLSALEETKDLW